MQYVNITHSNSERQEWFWIWTLFCLLLFGCSSICQICLVLIKYDLLLKLLASLNSFLWHFPLASQRGFKLPVPSKLYTMLDNILSPPRKRRSTKMAQFPASPSFSSSLSCDVLAVELIDKKCQGQDSVPVRAGHNFSMQPFPEKQQANSNMKRCGIGYWYI